MKKLNIALIAVLLIFQTVLMPLGTYGVTFAEESPSNTANLEVVALSKWNASKPIGDAANSELEDSSNWALVATSDIDKQADVSKPKLSDAIRVDFEFKFDNSAKSGDELTYQLPNYFALEDGATEGIAFEGTLNAPGITAAYTVSTSGLITITLTSKTVNDVSGNFSIITYFNEEEFKDSTSHELLFEINQSEIKIPLTFDNGTVLDMNKTVKTVPVYNPDKAVWEIVFNKSEDALKNVTVTDKFEAVHPAAEEGGQSTPVAQDFVKLQNIKIYELTIGADGQVHGEGKDVTADFNNPTAFPITLGDIEKAYRIVYETSLDENKPTIITNDASVEYGAGSKSALTDTATAHFNYGMQIAKEGSYTYNAAATDKHVMDWTVKYNYGEQASTGRLEDTMKAAAGVLPDTLKIVENSFQIVPVTFDELGTETFGTPLKDTDYSFNVAANKQGFSLQLGSGVDRSKAYKITYKSVDSQVLRDYQIENTVIAKEATDLPATATIDVKYRYVQKYVGESAIDYDKKEITWTVKVNEEKWEMGNFLIKDTYSAGLV